MHRLKMGGVHMVKHENPIHASVRLRKLAFDAPWAWLGAGWRDLWALPVYSMLYGAVFALAAFVITFGLYWAGWESLILPLAGGFLLTGPMFAVGLYEASRRLEAGLPVRLADMVFVGTRSPGQLAFLGVGLLILFFVWLEIALLLFMLFVGPTDLPHASEFVPALLFTWSGLGLLCAGTVAGALLAFAVYAVTAISVPLLMERKIDVVTAAMSSIEAIRRNPKPMLLWAALIAAMIAVGFATLFAGLAIVFPLIGHATWHAYRATVAPEPKPASRRKAPVRGRGACRR
ncbi:MAG: DUF2189 domain-containing protein, partial [Hyphomicrobiales bacterium]